MANPTFRAKVILAAILVIACLGVAYFLTTPRWRAYQASQTQLATLNTKKTQLNTSMQTIQDFLSTYNNHQLDVTTVNQALPTKSVDLAHFIANLEQLGQASGVALGNLEIGDPIITSDKPAAPNSLQSQTITLNASGTFPSLKDFVMRLENNLRIIDIQNMTMKSDDSGILTYQIVFKIYFQK